MLSTNLGQVEDSGYWNVKYYHDLILKLNKQPRKNKNRIKLLLEEAVKLSKYFEEHGGKKPD